MTEEESFDKLRKERNNFVFYLDHRDYGAIKNSVVDKYSDTAHFIYELIQNADDTGATKIKFILEKDRLIFKHNGSHFSLDNVRAITSIGYSTKQENQIGKFGVGFKSVFQYTSTPKIYDKN